MTRKTIKPAGANEPDPENAADDGEDDIRSVVGFASAICYLAYEAERAGWNETFEHLEETYSVFLDEIGTERVQLRVYSNPERS